MKKNLFYWGLMALVFLLDTRIVVGLTKKQATRSIFVPRGLTTNATLELALGNYDFYNKRRCDLSFIQAQAGYFHLKSRHPKRFARNLLPNHKTQAVIAEDGSGDIGSLYFNIVSLNQERFRENFIIRPERVVDGGYFNFYFDFNKLSNHLCGLWAEVAFAAAKVSHTLKYRDANIQNPGGDPKNSVFSQSLQLDNVKSGRLYNGCCSKSGVDDVMLKLGYNYYFGEEGHHLGIYGVGVIPTGSGTRARTIFEPLIGSNHGFLGFGSNINFILFANDCLSLNWMTDVRFLHGFKNKERRSFDLTKNGDWSRYLPIVSPNNRLERRPGINCFTREARINPRNQVDVWTAFHLESYNWHLEFDYNFFWRKEERIRLVDRYCTPNRTGCINSLEAGIYDISGVIAKRALSASQANISQTVAPAASTGNIAPSDTVFTPVNLEDLNRVSGAAKKAVTSTVSGFIGYDVPCLCVPVLLGIGGLYEFDHKKSVYEQWGVYFKSSLTF